MKKQLILSFFALYSFFVFGQNNSETRILIEAYETAKLGSSFNNRYSGVEGTPYLQNRFSAAKIKNVATNINVRYNVYDDEFEFIDSKNDTLVLNKTDDFNTITFVGTNTKYCYLNYSIDKDKVTSGYLIFLYEKKDYVLYKKQNISYFKEKISKNPLQASLPAKFVPTKDVFYFKNGSNGICEFPTSKKNLIKLFPEKKVQIEDFFKQNDIDFDKESDKKKILDFLAE